MSGDELITARSATGEFAIQVCEIHLKRVLSHSGERQEEVRAVHSRDPGCPLLRDASLLIPLDGSSQSQLLVECARRTLQQGTNRVRELYSYLSHPAAIGWCIFRWLSGSAFANLTVFFGNNLMVEGSTVKAFPRSGALAANDLERAM